MTPEEKAFLLKTIPPPAQAEHVEYSMLFSAIDELSGPSETLLQLALSVIDKARRIELREVSTRLGSSPNYVQVWPGEHYRLLAALVSELSPKRVVEIGTGGGLSALCMKQTLPPEGEILTFDLYELADLPGSFLLERDFQDGRLTYFNADLSTPASFDRYSELLASADLFLIDGAKDNVLEWKLLSNFRSLTFKRKPLVVFDDIRLWNMLQFWRLIPMPKLDLTSFGHWSGTGLVEWTS